MTKSSDVLQFILTVASLQASYLVWGIMQECIMNTKFEPTPLTPSGKFPSATFCVFSNRVVAVIIAYIACKRAHGTVFSQAPMLQFTPCSISNTLSSWAQYQALMYVPFSLQTLFKATKVIPVMIMGTVLKGTSYRLVEYAEACMITLGVGIFSSYRSTAGDTSPPEHADQEWLGYLCLCTYILCDSFTSQWQSKLYSTFGKIDHWHMMFGINMSSVVITIFGMVVQGEIPVVIDATGQIAIYFCIRKYGPTVFTIVMTTRQVFSILLSNILFDHPTTLMSAAGAVLVFITIFYSSYRRLGEKKSSEVAKPNDVDVEMARRQGEEGAQSLLSR
eukprot:GSChrysophyteH1.ASY1.ANO1.1933.1 assembled CDS